MPKADCPDLQSPASTVHQIQTNTLLWNNTLHSLQQQLVDSQARTALLEQRLHRSQGEKAHLLQQFKALNELQRDLQLIKQREEQHSSALQAQNKQLQCKCCDLEQSIARLQDQLAKNHQMRQRLQSQQREVRTDRDIVLGELEKERCRSKGLCEDNFSLNQIIKQKTLLAAGLETLIKTSQNSAQAFGDRFERELGVLNAEVQRSRHIICSTNKELSLALKDNEGLLIQLEKAKHQSIGLKKCLAEREQECGALLKSLEAISSDRNEVAARLDDTQKRAVKNSADKQSAEARVEELEMQNIRMKGELARLDREARAFLSLQEKVRCLDELSKERAVQFQQEQRGLTQNLEQQRRENLCLLERLQESGFQIRRTTQELNSIGAELEAAVQKNRQLCCTNSKLKERLTESEQQLLEIKLHTRNELYSMQEGAAIDLHSLLREREALLSDLKGLKQRLAKSESLHFGLKNDADEIIGKMQRQAHEEYMKLLANKQEAEATLRKQQHELSQLVRENRRMGMRVDQLENELRVRPVKECVAASARCVGERAENDSIWGEYQRLKGEYSRLKTEYMRAIDAFQEEKGRIQSLPRGGQGCSEGRALKERIQYLESQLARQPIQVDSRTKDSEILRENHRLIQRVRQLQSQQQPQRGEQYRFKSKGRDCEGQLKECQAQLRSNQVQLKGYQTQLRSYEAQIKNYEAQIAKLRMQVSKEERESQRLQQRIRELEAGRQPKSDSGEKMWKLREGELEGEVRRLRLLLEEMERNQAQWETGFQNWKRQIEVIAQHSGSQV